MVNGLVAAVYELAAKPSSRTQLFVQTSKLVCTQAALLVPALTSLLDQPALANAAIDLLVNAGCDVALNAAFDRIIFAPAVSAEQQAVHQNQSQRVFVGLALSQRPTARAFDLVDRVLRADDLTAHIKVIKKKKISK